MRQTKRKHRWLPLIAGLLLPVITGCVAPSGAGESSQIDWSAEAKLGSPAGTLVIAGGAVDPEGPVLVRFFEEAHKAAKRRGHGQTRVEIIPTASSDPAGSLQHNGDNFALIAPKAMIGGLPLSQEDQEDAFDPAIAARFADSSALWFTGGDQSRITQLFHPEFRFQSGSAPPPQMEARIIDRSALQLLHSGGVIGGSSAGAAIMSSPMIKGGRSEGALLHGQGPGGVKVGPGMGYFPFGIVDQHFLARGRLGRLLIATVTSHRRYGFGVEENSALIVSQGESAMIEVQGASGLCVVDMGPGYSDLALGDTMPLKPEEFPEVWEFEISLLGTGDRWDPVKGVAIPHQDRVPRTLPAGSPPPSDSSLGPWERGALAKAVVRLSLQPDQPQSLSNDVHVLQIISTSDTTFLVAPTNSSDLFATKIRVRITQISSR